jgi:hypothetical protein
MRRTIALILIVLPSCVNGSDSNIGARTSEALNVGTTYQLVRRGSNKCLDSAGEAAQLQQQTCTNGNDQSFRANDAGNGTINLVNIATGDCVDVRSSGKANGTVIQLWPCNGTTAQTFTVEDVGGGFSRVRNTNSNKCMGVKGNSSADGAVVELRTCGTSDAQKWQFNQVGGQAVCGTVNGATYLETYRSAFSRWCIDSTVFAAHAADFPKFYPYGDSVIQTLEQLFAHTPNGLPFTFQATVPTGGASTGSDFGFGNTVTGDAFSNVFQDPVTGASINGFFGYLLALHEAINDWTGDISADWPTDWWADHRSPFPNSMDFHIMQVIGQQSGNNDLQLSAIAQHNRLGNPSTPDFDSEVGMFDTLFDQHNGFNGFANVFQLVQTDGISWSAIGTNPSPLHSEYVIAFLQLGLGITSDQTQSLFVANGVGTKDTSVPSYTVDSNHIRAIGTAHCSIAAAKNDPNVSQATINNALNNLRSGNFAGANVQSRACSQSSDCPSECACASASHQCAARW